MELNQRIENFSWVLSDLIVDLGTSSKFYRECVSKPDYDPFKNKYHLGQVRMCHMWTIVSLSKLCEALNGYADELKLCCTEEIVKSSWKFKAEIEKKKVYEFRNKYAAHVFDSDTNQPLDLKTGYDKFTSIVGNTPDEVMEFYDWINSRVETNDDLLAQLVKINGCLENYLGGIPSRK
ncbi:MULTISPECIES: hypothetical protein [Vibrio]|uniref:hypothetical protein n=1 Tax=Vibrio TaxID=662 RepID=UPI0013B37C40|nr:MULTISPECIES: hypothetical protein [Vibrio]MCG6291574.1 hypothetical protein [Vibrio vulnificus]